MRGSRADSSIDGSEAPSAKIFMFLIVAAIDMLAPEGRRSLANRDPEEKSEEKTGEKGALSVSVACRPRRGSSRRAAAAGLQRHHEVHGAAVGRVAANDLLADDAQPGPL